MSNNVQHRRHANVAPFGKTVREIALKFVIQAMEDRGQCGRAGSTAIHK